MQSSNTDVVILCGGFGTRLGDVVKDVPKPMLSVGNRPFLDIIASNVLAYGFKRIIFCVHYKSEVIRSRYQKQTNFEAVFSEEREPLGTGGALKLCKSHIKSDSVLVLNGDSHCSVNLSEFIRFHAEKKSQASVVLAKVDARQDVGFVKLNERGQITSFQEKEASAGVAYVNAGIYMISKEVIKIIPDRLKCSLEKDIFPSLNRNLFFGFTTNEALYDIGTPERLNHIKEVYV